VKFGRIRKTFMEYMREQYGFDVADRALKRINKRRTEGCLRKVHPN
jgi:hypothetical protein